MKTTNFENSKKLHEVGFKAKTIFAHSINNPQWGVQSFVIDIGIKDGYYPAYDLETILGALPAEISNYEYLGTTRKNPLVLILEKSNKHRPIFYTSPDFGGSYFGSRIQDGDCLADTAARLLIKLFEASIIRL